SGGGEAADVGRMHPVIDALVDPVVAACHGSFEVDDSGVGPSAGELVERVAPDVGVGYATWNRAVGALGEPHVVDRIAQVTLMDARLGWLSQNLIDSAARHHVAAKEQLDGLHRRRNLRTTSFRTSMSAPRLQALMRFHKRLFISCSFLFSISDRRAAQASNSASQLAISTRDATRAPRAFMA